jgi:hypothetical protein
VSFSSTSVRLGTFKSNGDVIKALESAGVKILTWGMDSLKRMVCLPDASSVNVKFRSGREMGLKAGCTIDKTIQRVVHLGCRTSPAETAAQFCLQHPNTLAEGERFFVAMIPIRYDEPQFRHLSEIFVVSKENGVLRVDALIYAPGYSDIGPDEKWLVRR